MLVDNWLSDLHHGVAQGSWVLKALPAYIIDVYYIFTDFVLHEQIVDSN